MMPNASKCQFSQEMTPRKHFCLRHLELFVSWRLDSFQLTTGRSSPESPDPGTSVLRIRGEGLPRETSEAGAPRDLLKQSLTSMNCVCFSCVVWMFGMWSRIDREVVFIKLSCLMNLIQFGLRDRICLHVEVCSVMHLKDQRSTGNLHNP